MLAAISAHVGDLPEPRRSPGSAPAHLAKRQDEVRVAGQIDAGREVIIDSVLALRRLDFRTVRRAAEVTERRRRVYEEMCAALRVFIAGHGGTAEAKVRFHSAHAAAWLWASDGVLAALNHFIELQVQHTARPGAIDQAQMKESYTAVVLAMRKDAGFANSVVAASDYKFVQF